MQGIALQSGWETFLLAAPIVGMILVGVFRLDEIAANSGRTRPTRVPGNDENGRVLSTDPDGRPWLDEKSWSDSPRAAGPSAN